MTKEEHIKKYGLEHYQNYIDRNRKWREMHREEMKIKGKKYHAKNREKELAWAKEYRKKNRETMLNKSKEYQKTKHGRAVHLVSLYKWSDKVTNREGFDLTPEWIEENIFTSSCVYCGDSDWEHLGCDRIDNTKPHTPDNCVCACGICNIEKADKYSVDEFKTYRLHNPRFIDLQERKRKGFNQVKK